MTIPRSPLHAQGKGMNVSCGDGNDLSAAASQPLRRERRTLRALQRENAGMDLFAGLDERTYGVGELHQQCRACKWWQRGHRRELDRCPMCGDALPPAQGLEFGGLYVERKPAGFMLHDGQNRFLRWHEADVPDTLRFVVAHWRQGVYGKLGEAGRLRSGQGPGGDPALQRFPFLHL
jgi:hypothetical protein